MTVTATVDARRMADAVRALAMDAVEAAKSGHPGMPMGMADVATVLFTRFLKFDPAAPDWPDRDRFVLSAGHGSMLLYALLHLTGYEDMTLEELKRFRQLGGRTAGHPEYGHAGGIETTTGPLGQGLGNAVGMAIAEAHLRARFGADLVDHRTFVLASDGDLMEGISQESIALAGHLNLDRLVVLFDDNGISIDGPLELADSVDQLARFEAAGWDAARVDGHDHAQVARAIENAMASGKPSLIACRTKIGYGAPTLAGSEKAHGAPLGAEEVAGARAALGWTYEPFDVPPDVSEAWGDAGRRGRSARAAWEARLEEAGDETAAEFRRQQSAEAPADADAALLKLKKTFADEAPSLATRQASGKALDAVAPAYPALVGGSADLAGSNNVNSKALEAMTAGDMSGRYIHFGVREHGMAAALNGLALHGGARPFGATFLVFTDYCRPSIRLAALMGLPVIYVMTHDSIGLGEDGPTHQPVEHLAALRAIPNLDVFRPADAVETAEAWAAAVQRREGPTLIALSRQKAPAVRTTHVDDNLAAKGAYVLSRAEGEERAVIIATGTEIAIALQAQGLLAEQSVGVRVVSMPSWERFAAQDAAYRDEVMGPGLPKVAVEAAARFGWDQWIGIEGGFVGMTDFGASAPAEELYKHFRITAEAVVDMVRARL